MLQWHQFKVYCLNGRPNHPILLQCCPVRAIELIFRICPLHVCHAAKEEEEIGRGEDGLVSQDAGGDGCILRFEDNTALEELVPKSCTGTKDGYCESLS